MRKVLNQLSRFTSASKEDKWQRLLRSNYALRGLISTEINEHESALIPILTWLNKLTGEPNRAEDQELAYAHYELGKVYGNLNRFEEAIQHLTASIDTLSRARSTDDHRLKASKISLGLIYCLLNKLKDAEDVLRLVLDDQEVVSRVDNAGGLRRVLSHNSSKTTTS